MVSSRKPVCACRSRDGSIELLLGAICIYTTILLAAHGNKYKPEQPSLFWALGAGHVFSRAELLLAGVGSWSANAKHDTGRAEGWA
jgi:hypothetical protein